MQRNPLFCTGFRKAFLCQFLLLFTLVLLFLTSCKTVKETSVFSTLPRDTTISGFVTNDFVSKIQPKDLLSITVSSLSLEMDNRFNGAAALAVGNTVATTPQPSYLVNEQGNIQVHFVGEIKAAGLTCKELKAKMEQDLLPYMKEPIISIKYLNRKVTIMGEVANPQVLYFTEEQLPLVDVLVRSGDFKEKANRKDIMVIRENGSEKQIKHLNLEDHSVLSSPWYYVQPNDIIYVMKEKGAVNTDEKRRTLQTTLSLIASTVSLVLIIVNALTR